jgi:LytS/YehU family sensor histidine kinase
MSALIHTDPERADALVNRLADLLRGYLSLDAVALVPLREEVRLLQHYVDICGLATRQQTTAIA